MGGLVVNGAELEGFAIAGEDRKWYWADAHIEGDTIIGVIALGAQSQAVFATPGSRIPRRPGSTAQDYQRPVPDRYLARYN